LAAVMAHSRLIKPCLTPKAGGPISRPALGTRQYRVLRAWSIWSIN